MQNVGDNGNVSKGEKLAIKELCLMADKCKLKKLRDRLIQKLEELENSENVDINEVNNLLNAIQKLDNLINQNQEVSINLGSSLKCEGGEWVNNKEMFEMLRGLVLGNYSYEDWNLVRLLFKVKIIERLLNEKE